MVIGTKAQEKRFQKAVTMEHEISESETGFTVHTWGDSYLVTRTGCSCPDHTRRCVEEHIYCKHRIAVWLYLLKAGREPGAVWGAKDARRCEIAVEEAKAKQEAAQAAPVFATTEEWATSLSDQELAAAMNQALEGSRNAQRLNMSDAYNRHTRRWNIMNQEWHRRLAGNSEDRCPDCEGKGGWWIGPANDICDPDWQDCKTCWATGLSAEGLRKKDAEEKAELAEMEEEHRARKAREEAAFQRIFA